MTRRVRLILCIVLGLGVVWVAIALAGPTSGRRDTLTSDAYAKGKIGFAVKRLRGRDLHAARLRIYGKSRALSLAGMRKAVTAGRLRVPARASVKQRLKHLSAKQRKRWLRAHTRLVALSLPHDAGTAGPAPEAAPGPYRAPTGTGNLLPIGGNVGCVPFYGTFGQERWPSACWRPYQSGSPFNQALPAFPAVDPRSTQIVDHLMGDLGANGPNPEPVTAGNDRWGHPIYWNAATDPEYTVHCVRDWGRCEVEGLKVHIPRGARAATGSDGHLAVVDQLNGWEYDFWQARKRPANGGRLDISWGGRTPVGYDHGDGRDSDSTASHFGQLAGIVRAPELQAEKVDHALFIVVPCDSGHRVFPASGVGSECAAQGRSDRDAPSEGTRFQLAMSDQEIDALNAPGWAKALYRAMAHYGMYVGDTGGGPWQVVQESDLTYTSFGARDKWLDFAERVGAQPGADGTFRLPYGNQIDWRHRLRVIAPCVAAKLC